MRSLILLPAILLVSCGEAAPDDGADSDVAALEAGLWTGGERDGLCVAADGSAAFIQYGDGDANCMAQGAIEGDGEGLTFVPRGDDQCRIPLLQEGDVITIGPAPETCAYYCGGDASLRGEGLRRSTGEASELRDVGGDPLC